MQYIITQVNLRPDQYNKLENLKHQLRKKDRTVSLASLIREAVDKYFEKEGK